MAKVRKSRGASAPRDGEDLLEGVGPAKREPSNFSKYIEAAKEIGGLDAWAPASEVLDFVTSVQTVFPDFNRAVRVGGLPVRRIHTVHGPTHGGKTAFVLGLVKSFVDRGFLSGYIDAEHTLGQEFAAEMVKDLGRKPNFMAVRPKSYEKTIAAADAFLVRASKVRDKFPEAKSILVVDSINKLVPERELEKLLKQGEVTNAGAKEMAKGHHGRYRAALNQAWLDHLVPLVAAADCALVIIAQERDDHEATSFFDSFKVKGGAALLFDASLVLRVMKATPVFIGGKAKEGEKKDNEQIAGFAHRVRIWKSKVGHMDGRHSDAIFHLSNGKITPAGLDTARDAFSVGVKLGVVKTSGSWFTFGKKKVQGEDRMVQVLAQEADKLGILLSEIGLELDRREGRPG